MDEDDIYGEDIYGSSVYGKQETGGGSGTFNTAGTGGGGNNTAEILSLQKSLAERDQRCLEVEAQLKAALSGVDKWKAAFRDAIPGTTDPRALQEPNTALQELKRQRALLEKPVNEDVGVLRQREATLQLQLAERNLENIDLRRHAHTAQQCADPGIAQVRQLLLDPAVQKEFERMKTELEKAAKEMKTLQEELQAVQFSQDSKTGRMLMAKCRALQDENEEMGKELAEGKVHSLERQVVLSKTFVEDMRARYIELEDHAHQLDGENEDLHQQVFHLKRQLREVEMRSVSAGGRERPMRPIGGRGPNMGITGPPSPPPRNYHNMNRYDGPPMTSPDGKHGPPRDMYRYDKRMRRD